MKPVARKRRTRRAAALVAATLAAGCGSLRRDNRPGEIQFATTRPAPSLAETFLRTNYLYPARDYLLWTWAGRALVGDEAWDVTPGGGVPDSAWYVNRNLARVDAATFGGAVRPRGPWRVIEPKRGGATAGFVGADASGRRWLVKLDDAEYPELGSAAEAIGSRLYWALGYRVPHTFVVRVSGTGDARFDGRRGCAVELIGGRLLGTASMDRFRMRREVRALRLAGVWLNETDRDDHNTIVADEDGAARVYLIDFNSALGSWNGRPKEAWRGWRCAWDVEWQCVMVATLGLVRPAIDERQPVVSRAVGRLAARVDVRRWRPQNPKTAFDRMTAADARWMAAKMAAVTDEMLARVVRAGEYSDRADERYVYETLRERRAAVIAAARAWR